MEYFLAFWIAYCILGLIGAGLIYWLSGWIGIAGRTNIGTFASAFLSSAVALVPPYILFQGHHDNEGLRFYLGVLGGTLVGFLAEYFAIKGLFNAAPEKAVKVALLTWGIHLLLLVVLFVILLINYCMTTGFNTGFFPNTNI